MDSNFTNLGYVEETTFGTTPAANLQLLRRTSDSIGPDQPTARSEEIRSDLRPGAPVRMSQMADGDVQVEWSSGTLDDILEGMFMEAWASGVLVDGTTKKSYTFEKQFVDPDISPSQYMSFKGSRIGSLSMELALESMVTGAFSIMSTTPAQAQASVGAGNTAETTTEVFNCTGMVTSLTEGAAGGSLASLGHVTGISLQFDRSLRWKQELGNLNPFQIGVGRLLVSGSLSQYFEDSALIDAYFAFADRALEFTLNDGTNSLQFELPKLKLVGRPRIDTPGADDDVIATYNFEGYADAADPAMFRVTRS